MQRRFGMYVELGEFSGLTHDIIGAAIEVHRALGPGLLESTYMPCLQYELRARRLKFIAERAVPIVYKGVAIDAKHRVDLIVEDRVLVEVKSVAVMAPVFEAQLLTYLFLTECPVGLLINFNVPLLTDGVIRKVNRKTYRGKADGAGGGNGRL